MGQTRSVDGIVVGRLDQGETDRIVRLLTPDEGLVSVWANRARLAKSPFSTLDLGVRARVGVRARALTAPGDLVTGIGVEVLEARVGIRSRLERLGPAAIACEAAAGLATTAADPRIFGCLETALLLLDRHGDDPGQGFTAALLAKLLTFGGLAPALDRCPVCGQPPVEPMAWFEPGGGAFHVAHLPPDAAGSPRIAVPTLLQLAQLRRIPLLDGYGAHAELAPMLSLVESHLGHALKARAWLADPDGTPV